MSKNLGVIQALFLNMGKQVVPYFKMTPELAQQFHKNLARIMMYVKDKGVTLSQKQKDYIQNQIKQLDMYEKSLTPSTTKGPKASVTDITKKLPEDAPYSEKNPKGWMPTEGEESAMQARGIMSEMGFNQSIVDDTINLLKDKDPKSLSDELKNIMLKKGTYADYNDIERKAVLDGIQKIIESRGGHLNFATGGRVGFNQGSKLKTFLRVGQLLKKEGTSLGKQIKATMDDFFQRSGDSKYDADALTDNFFQKLGVDVDDVYLDDKLNVYDKFYKELTKNKKLTPKEAFLKQYFAKKSKEKNMYEQAAQREMDAMEAAADVGMKEPMGLTNEEIYAKYQNKISDDLLKKIVIDDNPQRRAEVMATLDEAMTMMEKGMDQNQILNILKNMKRTKNASGGLNYLMGL